MFTAFITTFNLMYESTFQAFISTHTNDSSESLIDLTMCRTFNKYLDHPINNCSQVTFPIKNFNLIWNALIPIIWNRNSRHSSTISSSGLKIHKIHNLSIGGLIEMPFIRIDESSQKIYQFAFQLSMF